MSRSGIVNVRMVITEEKILSNIDKVHKLINPKSKKQIVQLEDDSYFKDLIESIKTYLIEYPKKKNFPASVYKAAYELVEYATNQFEENTKKIEELIRQREENIALSGRLKELIGIVDNKEKNWKDQVKEAEEEFPEDIIDTLNIVGKCKGKKDMERIEDRSKALSYIGIEIADALKGIPTPAENITPVVEEEPVQVEQKEQVNAAQQQYEQEVTFEKKPSLWQRFKNTKLVRAIRYITKIRIVIQYPALPEGKGSDNY